MDKNAAKVVIAMAIYRPDVKWLVEQLVSLNEQTYEGPMELLVWNDSPHDVDCESYLKEYITRFPYRVLSDGENHGVTIAFEKLTEAAEGNYICYCDQDDIWLSEKIEKSVLYIKTHPWIAACNCNISYIYADGRRLDRCLFSAGEVKAWNDIYIQIRKTLVRNRMPGCALLMKMKEAKNALPFVRCMYHDQWLVLYALQHGGHAVMEEVLLLHREHGNNTSARLKGIKNKKEYYDKKLDCEYAIFHEAAERSPFRAYFEESIHWVEAREKYRRKPSIGSFFQLMRCAHVRLDVSLFELLMPCIPNTIFGSLVRWLR